MARSLIPWTSEELLAFNVRCLRKIQKLSQKDVALRANVSQAEICRVETGRRNLALRRLCVVAEGLQVPWAWLLYTSDEWRTSEHRAFKTSGALSIVLTQLESQADIVSATHKLTKCVYSSMWLLHEIEQKRRQNGSKKTN